VRVCFSIRFDVRATSNRIRNDARERYAERRVLLSRTVIRKRKRKRDKPSPALQLFESKLSDGRHSTGGRVSQRSALTHT